MKNHLIIFLAVISTSFFVGCSSDDDFNPPNYVAFEGDEVEVSVTENSSTSREINVYASNITGSDRTLDINVDESSTLNPETYNVPSTVTIPGGTNVGTVTVDLTDNNLPNTGGTLVLDLGNQEGINRGGPITVNVSRFCPVVLEDYVDTSFAGAGSWSEIFGYTTEVEIFRNEEGDLMINGLLFQWIEGWWGEVIVRNEPVRIEIDPETGAINIPEQFYVETTYDGEPQPVYNIRGTGRINSCAGEMIIRPVLVQDGTELTGENWSGGVPFVETIRPGSGDTDGGDTDGGDTDGGDTDGGDTDGEDGDGEDSDEDGDGEDGDGEDSDEDGDGTEG